MDWQAVQAIAELLAAVGVIASLLYLAAQVRQNTRSMQAATSQDLLANFSSMVDFSAQSEYGAKLLTASLYGEWDDLTPEGQVSARMFWVRTTRLFEHAYLQRQSGFLDDESWHGWSQQIVFAVGLGGWQRVWPGVRMLLSPSFVAWVEEWGETAHLAREEYHAALRESGNHIPPQWSAP